MKLKLSDELSLPLDAATQTFAFLGRKGSGKTYAAGKLVELLLDAHVQVVIVDTVGNWYGLRLAANGKDAGFDVPVIGGLRGDIPIEEAGGALVANTLIETGRSAILDVSQFSLSARQRFAAAFGEQLWKLKKAEHHPSPLVVVIEECQLIIPQMVKPDQARMVGVFEEIVRLGRNYGIGAVMISQRPQSVNKEVLNQTECLFTFQTNGKQERDALKAWVVAQGASVDLVQELPGLPVGTAYVWSPQWLQIFKKVSIAAKKTYDASSTPKVGQKRGRARALAPLNLDDLHAQMKEVVDRAKADDPKELRKRIAELEKQLKAKATPPAPPPPPPIPQEQLDELFALAKEQEAWMKRLAKLTVNFGKMPKQVGNHIISVPYGAIPVVGANGQVRGWAKPRVRVDPALKPGEAYQELRGNNPLTRVVSAQEANGDDRLPDGERKVLVAVAQSRSGATREQVTLLTGYKRSTRDAYLQRLRGKGLVRDANNLLYATENAVELLGHAFEPLPTGDALMEHWLGRLPEGERAVLELLAGHRSGISREDVSDATGYKRSTRDAYIQRLRVRRLVEVEGGTVRAHAELFG